MAAAEEKEFAAAAAVDGDGEIDSKDGGVAGGGATGGPGGGGDSQEANGQGEEEGECPFCVYMKAGPCGGDFKAWEDCVESSQKEAEKLTDEIVVKCRGVTESLMKCMEQFTDYYGVVLQAGSRMNEEDQQENQSKSENHETTEGDVVSDEPPQTQVEETTA